MSKEQPLPVNPSPWQIAEANRRTNLYILALGATAMGLLLGLTAPENGPSFALLGQLPHWPLLWGLMLSAFGIAQLIGLVSDWRTIAFIGCSLAAVWYVGFALAFALTWFGWVLNEDGANPSVYPVAPYLTIGAMHLASAETIWHYWKTARTPRHPEGQVLPDAPPAP